MRPQPRNARPGNETRAPFDCDRGIELGDKASQSCSWASQPTARNQCRRGARDNVNAYGLCAPIDALNSELSIMG